MFPHGSPVSGSIGRSSSMTRLMRWASSYAPRGSSTVTTVLIRPSCSFSTSHAKAPARSSALRAATSGSFSLSGLGMLAKTKSSVLMSTSNSARPSTSWPMASMASTSSRRAMTSRRALSSVSSCSPFSIRWSIVTSSTAFSLTDRDCSVDGAAPAAPATASVAICANRSLTCCSSACAGYYAYYPVCGNVCVTCPVSGRKVIGSIASPVKPSYAGVLWAIENRIVHL